MRTSRLLATPNTPASRAAPSSSTSYSSSRTAASQKSQASLPVAKSTSTSTTGSTITITKVRQAAAAAAAPTLTPAVTFDESTPECLPSSSPLSEGGKLELEERVLTLSKMLKETTEQLHSAHVDIRRYKQILASSSVTSHPQQQQQRPSITSHSALLLHPPEQQTLMLGSSAFDRRVVSWLVRNGMLSSAALAEEEHARVAKSGRSSITDNESRSNEASPAAPAFTPTAASTFETSIAKDADLRSGNGSGSGSGSSGTGRKVLSIALDLEAEGNEETEQDDIEAVAKEKDVKAAPSSSSSDAAATTATAAGPEVEETVEPDDDESSVDSGFGELGVDELPEGHTRDDNRVRIGYQTPFVENDDDTMALIYSKPGIASSAVYISATDLYMIITQELMELKSTLNARDSFFLELISQGCEL